MLAQSIAADRMELPLSSRRAAATAVASDVSTAARLAGEQASVLDRLARERGGKQLALAKLQAELLELQRTEQSEPGAAAHEHIAQLHAMMARVATELEAQRRSEATLNFMRGGSNRPNPTPRPLTLTSTSLPLYSSALTPAPTRTPNPNPNHRGRTEREHRLAGGKLPAARCELERDRRGAAELEGLRCDTLSAWRVSQRTNAAYRAQLEQQRRMTHINHIAPRSHHPSDSTPHV